MHELLEIILEDLHHMYEEGLYSKEVFEYIVADIEAREYEYCEMLQGREDEQ